MMREIITGKNLKDVKAQAEAKFGVPKEKISFRVIEEKKGIFGVYAALVEAIYNPGEDGEPGSSAGSVSDEVTLTAGGRVKPVTVTPPKFVRSAQGVTPTGAAEPTPQPVPPAEENAARFTKEPAAPAAYAAEETPTNRYAVEETPANPYAAEETPANPYAVEETPANPYAVEETPANPYAAEETPVNPYAVEETPANPYAAQEAPVNPYAAEEISAARYATEETPAEPAPAPKYTAPEPAPAPKYTAPEPAPAPKYTAPEPVPAPKYTAPEPVPAPKYTAPEPVPAPKYTAPEPVPAPKYTAPEPVPAPKYTAPEPTPASKYTAPEPVPASKFTAPAAKPAEEKTSVRNKFTFGDKNYSTKPQKSNFKARQDDLEFRETIVLPTDNEEQGNRKVIAEGQERPRMQKASLNEIDPPAHPEGMEEIVEKVYTENQLTEAMKDTRDYIVSIYAAMEIYVTVEVKRTNNGILMELTSGSKNGAIIGRRGETLDSIQYLASIMLNRDSDEYARLLLDANGYRERRRATLEQLADKIARNVARSGRSTTLEPMNPYERRIIHSRISGIEGVTSRSVGEDPYRKVVISSTQKPQKQRSRQGGNKRGYRQDLKRPEDFHRKSLDSMKTSFERDYKKPRPEDELYTGYIGKIEL